MSRRTVTDYELSRRVAMADAKGVILKAMSESNDTRELTSLEWCWVLVDLQTFIIGERLKGEWEEGER